MSSYMQAWRRLRADAPSEERPATSDERVATVPTAIGALDGAASSLVARRASLPPPRASAPAAPEIAALFDRLRTLAAQGAAARLLVFAPVTPGGAGRRVVDALAARGRELALQVAAAELTRSGGQALLAARGGAPRALALDGPALAASLADWLGDCGAAPLVLIDAPPVQTSVDGLLLAAACDGLVLVAETGATARGALRDAAARASATGCRILGVVLMNGSGVRR